MLITVAVNIAAYVSQLQINPICSRYFRNVLWMICFPAVLVVEPVETDI